MSDMNSLEILVALIAVLVGFALVSMVTDLWRKPPPPARPTDDEPKDGRT